MAGHREQATRLVARSDELMSDGHAQLVAAQAQVHATLAIADALEQQLEFVMGNLSDQIADQVAKKLGHLLTTTAPKG
ncbi:hypothetical protein SEA_PCORAL7_61 [Gordonia phage PCoral7]|uniref:Uncharacterized protein n=1 Tax=Gordonia phage Toast TaxID=2599852 RepID=A0A5J6TB57_9CAUD|nr:hypothetical protein JZX81_gp61 [Gordonia phage Toast]QFG08121.1 hypothetical protein PBI_TOAST_61 [Gordonia phage Toast]UVF60569.1 hypothetical protein SEA_PCORAL7_61 [Gordonia phage PCoral7]